MPSNTVNEKDHTKINDEIVVDVTTTGGGRPKSKKELRLERKAGKKQKAEQTKTAAAKEKATPTSTSASASTTAAPLLDKEEYRRLKRLQKAELLKEKEILMRNKLKEEKKLRKRKMLNREKNAKGGTHKKKQKTASTSASTSTSTTMGETDTPKAKSSRDEQKASMDAFRSVLYGANSSDASSKAGGMTTTRLGVQYEDKVVGTGKRAREGMPVTVRYELTGGKFGAVLDSSKKFAFQLGMGEVIQGWVSTQASNQLAISFYACIECLVVCAISMFGSLDSKLAS